MNSPNEPFGSNGFGVGGGPKGGVGVFWHNTTQIITTEKFNIIEGYRRVAENPNSKFWRR